VYTNGLTVQDSTGSAFIYDSRLFSYCLQIFNKVHCRVSMVMCLTIGLSLRFWVKYPIFIRQKSVMFYWMLSHTGLLHDPPSTRMSMCCTCRLLEASTSFRISSPGLIASVVLDNHAESLKNSCWTYVRIVNLGRTGMACIHINCSPKYIWDLKLAYL
jgi:hypothetical protein